MTTETATHCKTERRRSAKLSLTVADLLEIAGLWEEVEGRALTILRPSPPHYPEGSQVPVEEQVIFQCEISWPENSE